jgi:hypothetical protein
MSAEIWATVGTIAATLLLLVVPGLVYTWYALEHMMRSAPSRGAPHR